jgi:hypothetical protein
VIAVLLNVSTSLANTVDAIDPNPPTKIHVPSRIRFFRCRLEEFNSTQRYDLVLASMVSHQVDYDLSGYLKRLNALAKPDGLVYVTLLGNDDGWTVSPRAKAVTFEAACEAIGDQRLRILFRSVEWFNGRVGRRWPILMKNGPRQPAMRPLFRHVQEVRLILESTSTLEGQSAGANLPCVSLVLLSGGETSKGGMVAEKNYLNSPFSHRSHTRNSATRETGSSSCQLSSPPFALG